MAEVPEAVAAGVRLTTAKTPSGSGVAFSAQTRQSYLPAEGLSHVRVLLDPSVTAPDDIVTLVKSEAE